MSLAVLDLGTNTFNLLIADRADNNNFQLIHRSILPVKLGRGGINNNIILPEAVNRAYEAFGKHADTISQHNPEIIYAFATSAFRSAQNGKWLASELTNRYGIQVSIIDGDTEASLIYDGIRASLNKCPEPFIVLDIGGGSNEFIIGTQHHILWKKSFPIGIARLIEKFPASDPVLTAEIEILYRFFDDSLSELILASQQYKPVTLIGASGAFDTIYSLCKTAFPHKYHDDSIFSREIFPEDFDFIFNKIVFSGKNELNVMRGLEPARIEMIVYASLFIRYVLVRLSISQLIQSEFSLKEGVMWRWLNHLPVI